MRAKAAYVPRLSNWILVNSFLFMIAVYFYRMFYFESISPGILFSLMFVILWIVNLKAVIWSAYYRSRVFSLFLAGIVLSVLNYLLSSHNDIELFFYGLIYSVLPMIYFYLGTMCSEAVYYKFIKKLIIANAIICIAGLGLLLGTPSFYIAYLGKVEPYFSFSNFKLYPRLSSIFGSTLVGCVCAYSIPLIFSLYIKRVIRFYNFVWLFILFFLCGMLSFQRGAWLGMTVTTTISLAVICYKYYYKKPIIVVAIVLFLLLTGYIGFQVLVHENSEGWFHDRISSISSGDLISDRQSQWNLGISLIRTRPLGYGVGSFSHKAVWLGRTGIPDGNYFQLLAEYGIILFLLFVAVCVAACVKSFIHDKLIFACIAAFLLQAVGSSLLDFPYASSFFWFLLGYSWTAKSKVQSHHHALIRTQH